MSEERRKIGSYEIVRLLGKGGMSEVYEFDDDFGEGKSRKSKDDAAVAAERKDRATLDAVRLLLDRASKRLHGLLEK